MGTGKQCQTFESEITFFILNGRHGDDKGEGRVTCKGVSTVDYCIGTSSLFKILY